MNYVGTATHHGNQIVAWSTRDRRPEDIGVTASTRSASGLACRDGEGLPARAYRTNAELEGLAYEQEHGFSEEELEALSAEDEEQRAEQEGPQSLADINRAHRMKFQSRRAVRDHDLAHRPVLTLADINAVNRRRQA